MKVVYTVEVCDPTEGGRLLALYDAEEEAVRTARTFAEDCHYATPLHEFTNEESPSHVRTIYCGDTSWIVSRWEVQ